MRILWITDDFLPHYGGSRLLYYQIIKCFAPGEVTVLTKRRPGWRVFDGRENFPVRRGFFKKLPGPRLTTDLAIYAEMLLRGGLLLLRGRFDVILCGELLPTALVGRILSILSGRPYVIYIHGEEVSICEKLRGERLVAFSLLRAADAVIAASSEAWKKAVSNGVREERMYLLTPGVSADFLSRRPAPERIKARYNLGNRRILLTVGRMVERKGHEAVIRILPGLISEYGGVVYLVVGTGPHERELRRAARLAGVEDSIVFTGRLARDDLIDCYDACDIFVMPNRELEDGDTEGGGIVFLEASSRGKPVIAGRAGGTGDSVREGVTGFRVDAGAPRELKERILRLLHDPGLARRMGEAGRKMVAEERRWEDRARELRRICGRLACGKSRRRR